MNIFYLDRDPTEAAKHQYNKHVVKMILESAQMLCTAHRMHMLDYECHHIPYKKAHVNHPSSIWARRSAENYAWLYWHMLELGRQYTLRYGKIHKTIKDCEKVLRHLPGGILHTGFEDPPQCMPDEYKDECTVKAYWKYYVGDKKNVANRDETVKTEIPKQYV